MTYLCSVLGVDPGKDTGVALARIYHDEGQQSPLLGQHRIDVVSHGDAMFEEPRQLATFIQRAAAGEPNLHLVVEHYVLTRVSTSAQATWSLEVIGMVRLCNALLAYPCPIDVTQKPGDIKKLIPMSVYRRLAPIPKSVSTTDHVIDAVRHIILYVARSELGLVDLRSIAQRR